jgi:2-haloacid dehalogenase
VILSNGTDDALERAIRSAGLADHLDLSLSVDALKTFKTAPAVYQMACDRYGLPPSKISFQSSNRWDVAGATKFGFRTCWINRSGAPDEYADLPPAVVATSLSFLSGG